MIVGSIRNEIKRFFKYMGVKRICLYVDWNNLKMGEEGWVRMERWGYILGIISIFSFFFCILNFSWIYFFNREICMI